MRNLRWESFDRSIASDEPQLGRVPRIAACEGPGREFMALAFDRSAPVTQISELADRAEAAAPLARPTRVVAQFVAADPQR